MTTNVRSADQRYRVVLADDHQDILDELRYLLDSSFEVLATTKDGVELIDAVTRLRPDAVICDLYMPRLNGIESGAQILRRDLCHSVIILTMHNDPHLVKKAIGEGIQGYVLKQDASDELIPAILSVLGGGKYLSHGVNGVARD